MTENDSTFGMNPQYLDKLLEMGLDSETDDIIQTTPIDQLIERPGVQVGRYKLLSILGEGGMGVVFLAEQQEPVRRHVALKVIKPGMDSKRVIARFEAEQQALALMDHPHVAQVYDAGLAPSGRPFFVMEHVKGISITEYCDKHRFTIEERLRLFLHVLEAIQHAHQKGIIHRDLKPSNILVVVKGKEAVPKVIDFGVARATSRPLTERTRCTEQGQLIGTPEYMSPEQADLNNQDIDTRTDIYSLGVVLYELLVGMLPFGRKTFREGGIDHIRKVICQADPITPSTRLSRTSAEESTKSARHRRTDVRILERKLQGDLDWITLKAMEKDRNRRYATVESFSVDLCNYLNHKPVVAAPPDILYRLKKFTRRHSQAIAVVTMAAVILIGGLWATWTYLQARREHTRSEFLVHNRRLTEAQTEFSSGKFDAVSEKVDSLLESPHVGRQAELLHAQLTLEQEGPNAAIPELEDLIRKEDDIAGQAHFLLANIYYESDPWEPEKTQKNRQKYEHHNKQAEELLDGSAQYYYLKAKAAHIVRLKLRLLEKALQIDPAHYDSLRERTYIHYAQKDYHLMAEDAARMIGMRPTEGLAYALRAIARRELGRFTEALRDHAVAIRLSPDEPVLYNQRRHTYMDMGDYKAALTDARKVVELQSEFIVYHFHVFAALVGLGDYEEAEKQYRRILEQPDVVNVYSPFWPFPKGEIHIKFWFKHWSCQYVFEALTAGRTWHAPGPAPTGEAFCYLNEAADYYYELTKKASLICFDSTHASWSPDGTRLIYTTGGVGRTAITIYDTKTQQKEILVIPGYDAEWSPDGRFITFAGRRQSLSLERFIDIEGNWEARRTKGPPRLPPEVWVIETRKDRLWSVGKGNCPSWGRDSRHIYYRSYVDGNYYRASIEQGKPEPETLMSDAGTYPVISPDEHYVADSKFRTLRVTDLHSQQIVTRWHTPPFPARGLLVQWSPDGREISVGGYHGTTMGLWIYDIKNRQAQRMLSGPITTARWSPDRSKMVIALAAPYLQIWAANIDPNVPTPEAFGAARTAQEHCLELIDYYNQAISVDCNYIDSYQCRVDAALWAKHPDAQIYLNEFKAVLERLPYRAFGCYRRACAILSSSEELRDRLLPLALLLARKAVEKEPNNYSFLRTLGIALHHSGKHSESEEILLKAIRLSTEDTNTSRLETTESILALIELYETWDKPEKAEQWRAKLRQTEAVDK